MDYYSLLSSPVPRNCLQSGNKFLSYKIIREYELIYFIIEVIGNKSLRCFFYGQTETIGFVYWPASKIWLNNLIWE